MMARLEPRPPPAVGGDSSFWAPQARALAPTHEVLALDFVRPAAELSMAAFASMVVAGPRSTQSNR
jgi:hypothetical protein